MLWSPERAHCLHNMHNNKCEWLYLKALINVKQIVVTEASGTLNLFLLSFCGTAFLGNVFAFYFILIPVLRFCLVFSRSRYLSLYFHSGAE